MNKSEFVDLIASEHGCSKRDAEESLNRIVSSFISAIRSGESVNLVGFGSFSIHHREARKGRNPKTGAEMEIAAYNQPVFKPGQKLKDAANNC